MIQEIREERLDKKKYECFLEYYENAMMDKEQNQALLGRRTLGPISNTSACTGNTAASQHNGVLYPSSTPSLTLSSCEMNDVQQQPSTLPETDTDRLTDTTDIDTADK